MVSTMSGMPACTCGSADLWFAACTALPRHRNVEHFECIVFYDYDVHVEPGAFGVLI